MKLATLSIAALLSLGCSSDDSKDDAATGGTSGGGTGAGGSSNGGSSGSSGGTSGSAGSPSGGTGSGGTSGSSAGGSAGAGPGLLFEDDFGSLGAGDLTYDGVQNDPAFVAAGYDVGDPSLGDGVCAIESMSDAIAGAPGLANVTLVANGVTYSIPSSKAQLLHISYGDEEPCMLRFRPGPDLEEAWMSWWEYRPPGQDFAGEKGNRINSRMPNGNVGLDVILGVGLENGGNQTQPGITKGATVQMFAQGAHVKSLELGGTTFDWNTGTLHHFEVGLHVSTGTDANGSVEVYLDGEPIVDEQSVQYFIGDPDVPPGIQSFEIGGWLSGGVGLVAPMQRYILGWRVATERQGVWQIE